MQTSHRKGETKKLQCKHEDQQKKNSTSGDTGLLVSVLVSDQKKIIEKDSTKAARRKQYEKKEVAFCAGALKKKQITLIIDTNFLKIFP